MPSIERCDEKLAYALGVVVSHKHVRLVGGKEAVVVDILQVVRPEGRQESVCKAESGKPFQVSGELGWM